MTIKYGKVIAGILVVLVVAVVLTAIVSATVYAVVWSIQDIQMSGIRFWNVWWLMWVGFLYLYALGTAIKNS